MSRRILFSFGHCNKNIGPNSWLVRYHTALKPTSCKRARPNTASHRRFPVWIRQSLRQCCRRSLKLRFIRSSYVRIAFVVNLRNSLALGRVIAMASSLDSCRLYRFIVYTLIMGTLIVVGVIGNSLTFVVFWKGNFKSSTSFLFLSLSLIDSALLLAVFSVGTMVAFVDYTGWMQSYFSVYPYLGAYLFPTILLAKTAAIWVVVLVAVNRYIIVCLPLRAPQWCTVSKVKIQLAVVLIAAVLYNIPKFAEKRVAYYAKPMSNDNTVDIAYLDYTMFGEVRLFYRIYDTICLLIFLLVLPIVTLTVITIRLIKALKAHRRMQLEMQSRSQQNDGGVTFSLVIVVIVFIVCQVPTFVLYALNEVLPSDAFDCGSVMFYFGGIVDLLIALNSSINFFIYIVANKAFRGVLVEKVFGRCTKIPVVTAHEMDSVGRV